MRTIFTASRIKDPGTMSYTVLIRASGTESVDVSIWLNDAEARDLGEQLLRAATPATTLEAAA